MNFFQIVKDYHSLLTWELWFIAIFFIVAVLSVVTYCVIEFRFKTKKHKKYAKKLETLQKKSIIVTFLSIVGLGILPMFFMISNKAGFFNGTLFLISIGLVIFLAVDFFDWCPMRKKNKKFKGHLALWFALLFLTVITLYFVVSQTDYIDRLEKEDVIRK